ncbi:MAG: flavin-containing monooxygenase [Gammaproteobacteria bacterium]
MTGTSDDQPAGTVDAVVIGAGHAGLAISHCLRERAIDHVVIERGDVANSWRNERWESLKLLTPNWQSRLPGFSYSGDDPDGYMSMPEVIDFIGQYAKKIDAPVLTQTEVTSVRRDANQYEVETVKGNWRSRAVILASGACNLPAFPPAAAACPTQVTSLTPHSYSNPSQLADGGVLVVGASATGLQLADEIRQAGRPVTIAVGEHVRLPRVYRGRDIQWWMHAAGVLDESLGDIDDIGRARNIPSPQLVGSRDRPILDLNAMSDSGIRLVGRLMNFSGNKAQFSGSLRNVCALADLKMGRLLDAIDEWAAAQPESGSFAPPERYERTRIDEDPCLVLDVDQDNIRTILWATGYRADYKWLDIPVLDRKGKLRHDRGIVSDSPGMYVIGLPFLRRRKSSFIHGTEDDANFITNHLTEFLGRR